jgi:hypothetical protein
MATPESTTTAEPSPYRGRVIAVGTQHGKQHQFAPPFRRVLGAELVTPTTDTDQFGTFTGEVARTGSATDAARAKARLAMSATGLPYGLSSEASYGRLPGGWLGHEEILLFCDDVAGIEIVEGHRTSAVPAVAQRVSGYDDVCGPLLDGLPGQALIVRPLGAAGTITKGINGTDALSSAIAAAISASPDGVALVEPDLRAHHNPGRRLILARLAETMARRLAIPCSSCGAPGFGRVDAELGLPCRVCQTPTALRRNEIHACAVCEHHESRPVGATADPADCPACNP